MGQMFCGLRAKAGSNEVMFLNSLYLKTALESTDLSSPQLITSDRKSVPRKREIEKGKRLRFKIVSLSQN